MAVADFTGKARDSRRKILLVLFFKKGLLTNFAAMTISRPIAKTRAATTVEGVTKLANHLRPTGLLIVSVLYALSFAAPAQAGSRVIRDVPYGPFPKETLDICPPDNPGTATIGVVAIHAGGLFSGDKALLTPRACSWFNGRNVLVVSINYRLADGTGVGKWPSALVDAQLAVRWVRAHAADYGVKLHRLCAVGASSGGHLSVFLDALANPAPGDVASLLPGISPTVDCAVNQWGPVNYLDPSPIMLREMTLLFPQSQERDQQANARALSPLLLVHPGMGPVLVMQGQSDIGTPPSQATTLLDRLKQAGVASRLITFSGGHAVKSADWDRMALQYLVPFVMGGS